MTSLAAPRPLHAGVARAHAIIAARDPGAGREFARVTGAADAACGGGAWAGAWLNQHDAPLEFGFSTACRDLRYTMEVGGCASAPGSRLAIVDALLTELGVDAGWDGVARRFPALQRDATLAWGAWLAARQPVPQREAEPTRYKIYAEVPAAAHEAAMTLLRSYLGPAPLAAAPRARLVMLGAAPGSQRCEFYFELGSRELSLDCLRALLAQASLAHWRDALAALVGRFDFRRGRSTDALPQAQYGFSYSVLPDGREAEFSLLAFAADLAGGDAWVRQQVLAVAAGRGLDLAVYGALSAPLAQRDAGTRFHNMITFSVGERAPPGWQISLSPPPDADVFQASGCTGRAAQRAGRQCDAAPPVGAACHFPQSVLN
ncbi:hypothetical protein F2P45_29680 [Massilia sp. CCM 8733]|uniref:Uncharacterized protein n=1 Tax=Massilia mucilaginosa TaxID=2609282 RepID=A0ABX0P2Y8_9BURK|nr:hypothetical protein [Massilia mucilaginosa]NHZ93150.1 hypothetical protein [Massilia mucilaginosa]